MMNVQETLKALVDEGIELEKEIKEAKKKLDGIKATLTTSAFEEIENRNLKFLQIFGTKGHLNVTYKEKFEIDNFERLVDVLGELALAKISRKQEIKYETDARLKAALIALLRGEYSDGITPEEVLKGLGLDEKTQKMVLKKLKGDYIKDKKVFESVGIQKDCEEELDAIRMYKNYELVNRFFGELSPAQIEQVKKSVFVEDGISVGLEYQN